MSWIRKEVWQTTDNLTEQERREELVVRIEPFATLKSDRREERFPRTVLLRFRLWHRVNVSVTNMLRQEVFVARTDTASLGGRRATIRVLDRGCHHTQQDENLGHSCSGDNMEQWVAQISSPGNSIFLLCALLQALTLDACTCNFSRRQTALQ